MTVHLAKTQISLASAQSDQSLRCALNGQLKVQGFFMRTVKTLIRRRMPRLIWVFAGGTVIWLVCHEAAHMVCVVWYNFKFLLLTKYWVWFRWPTFKESERVWKCTFEFGTYCLCEQRVKRNLQTESQIPGPSEWLGMHSWNLWWWNARRHKFAWRGSHGY